MPWLFRPMAQDFKAEDFIERLRRGDFDGNLRTELAKLTDRELEQVAIAIAAQIGIASPN